MALRTLTKGAVKAIDRAVDKLFDRVKGHVFGPDFVQRNGDKKIFVRFRPALSLPGIYKQAAVNQEAKPSDRTLGSLVKVAESYLDAERERTRAHVLHAVNAWLAKDPDADPEVVLGGELAGVFTTTVKNVAKILDTSVTTARNTGSMEGISRVAAGSNIEDPTVYFITARDSDVCDECRKIHLLPDGKTPRAWKMSEVSGGYHERGDDHPCIGGLHPSCRCTLASLLPGYGFGPAGNVRFVALGHDELARQRE